MQGLPSCTAPKPTPRRYATRQLMSSPRWACASRRRRPRSATSTRASTSSASASSGSRTGQRADRLHLPDQESGSLGHRESTGGHPDSTCHWWSCSTGSRRSCGAGPTTSNTSCLRRPSTTYAASPDVGCCCGSAANTAVRTGSGSDAATCPGGGPRMATRHCSTPAR